MTPGPIKDAQPVLKIDSSVHQMPHSLYVAWYEMVDILAKME